MGRKNTRGVAKHLCWLICVSLLFSGNFGKNVSFAEVKKGKLEFLAPKSILQVYENTDSVQFSDDSNLSDAEKADFESIVGTDNDLLAAVMQYMGKDKNVKENTETDFSKAEKKVQHIIQLMYKPEHLTAASLAEIYSMLLEEGLIEKSYLLQQLKYAESYLKAQMIKAFIHMDKKYIQGDIADAIAPLIKSSNTPEQAAAAEFFIATGNEFIAEKVVEDFFYLAAASSLEKGVQAIAFFAKHDLSSVDTKVIPKLFNLLDNRSESANDIAAEILALMAKEGNIAEINKLLLPRLDDISFKTRQRAVKILTGMDKNLISAQTAADIVKLCADSDMEVAIEALNFVASNQDAVITEDVLNAFRIALKSSIVSQKIALKAAPGLNHMLTLDDLLGIAAVALGNDKDLNQSVLDFFASLDKSILNEDALIVLIEEISSGGYLSKDLVISLLGVLDKKVITPGVLKSIVMLLDDDYTNFLNALNRYLQQVDKDLITADVVTTVIDYVARGKVANSDSLKNVISRAPKESFDETHVKEIAKLIGKTDNKIFEEMVYCLAKADSSLITQDMVTSVFEEVKKSTDSISTAAVVFLARLPKDLMTDEIKDYFFEMLKVSVGSLQQDAIRFFASLDKEQMTKGLMDDIAALLNDKSPFVVSAAVQVFHEMSETLYTQDILDGVTALLKSDKQFLVNIAIAFLGDAEDKWITEDLVEQIISLHGMTAAVGRAVSKFCLDRLTSEQVLSYYDKISAFFDSDFEIVRQNAAYMFLRMDSALITDDVKAKFKVLLDDPNDSVKQMGIEFFIQKDDSYLTDDVKKDLLHMLVAGNVADLPKTFELARRLGPELATKETISSILDLFDSSVWKVRLFAAKLILNMDQSLINDEVARGMADLLGDANADVCSVAVDFLAATDGKYISSLVLSDILALADDFLMEDKVSGYVKKMFLEPFKKVGFTKEQLFDQSVFAVKDNFKLNKSVSLPLQMVSTILQKNEIENAFDKVMPLTDLNLKISNERSIPVLNKILLDLNQPVAVMEMLYDERKHDMLIAFMRLVAEGKKDFPQEVSEMLNDIADGMIKGEVDGFYMMAYIEFFANFAHKLEEGRYTDKLNEISSILIEKVKSGDQELSMQEVYKIIILVKDSISQEELAKMFVGYLEAENDFADYLVKQLHAKNILEQDLTDMFKAVLATDVLKGTNIRTQIAFYDVAGVTEDEDVMDYLVKVFKTDKNKSIQSSLAAFLETYYESAEELFDEVYAEYREDLQEFYKVVPQLKYMDCIGFRASFMTDIEALRDFVKQLKKTKEILGETEFKVATGQWTSLEDITLLLPLKKEPETFELYDYHVPHVFKGMNFRSVREKDTFASIGFDKGSDNHSDLRKKYYDFQENLINPNFMALELINANSKYMTKAVAFKIIELAETMSEALYALNKSKGGVAIGHLKLIRTELEEELVDLSLSDNIPSVLLSRITRLENNMENIHSVIRYMHQFGIEALTNRLQRANANTKVHIYGEDILISNLGSEPVVKDGRINSRPFKVVLDMLKNVNETYHAHPFILIDNYISWSCSLGEHRVEVDCDLNAPDDGGFLRIRYFEGGNDIGNELRREYLVSVLKGLGMNVNVAFSQEGMQYKLDAVFDKDHGALSMQELEYVLKMALRSFHFTSNLDWAFEATVEHLKATDDLENSEAVDETRDIVRDMGEIYLAEESMPFFARARAEDDIALYSRYKDYKASEARRKQLLGKLNFNLKKIGYPQIPESAQFGQRLINEYYNKPVRAGLASGQLVLNADDEPQLNKKYDVFANVMKGFMEAEAVSMQTATSLNMLPAESIDYTVKGYIGRLAVVSGYMELDLGGMVFVEGLRDNATGKLFYAVSSLSKTDGSITRLDDKETVKILSEQGYDIHLAEKPSPQQKRAAEKLLRAAPNVKEKGISQGIAASAGSGNWVTGKVSFNGDYAKNADPEKVIFATPFTTPDDIDAIKQAGAVLTTGGGILSHAGITTREFGIPAAIMTESSWVKDGVISKRLELYSDEKGDVVKDEQGFFVVREIEKVTKEIHHGDIVMINGKTGATKVFDHTSQKLLSDAYALISGLEKGTKAVSDVEKWLRTKSMTKWFSFAKTKEHDNQAFVDAVEYLFVTAIGSQVLKDKNLSLGVIRAVHDLGEAKLPKEITDGIKTFKESFFKESLENFEFSLEEFEQEAESITDVRKLELLLLRMQKQFDDIEYIASVLMQDNEKLAELEAKVMDFETMLFERFYFLTKKAGKELVDMLKKDLDITELISIRKVLRRHFVDEPATNIKNVVFVCTGNTCRSPMAEYMFKQKLKEAGITDIKVLSRGTNPANDSLDPIAVNSEAVLAEEGITDVVHTAALLTKEDINNADLILTMGGRHLNAIEAEFPESADKLFRLKDFGRQDTGDIADPFGKDLDVYRRTGRQIKGAVNALFERINISRSFAKLRFKEKELSWLKQQGEISHDKMVYNLTDIDDDYVDVVGGKSAKLGQIQQLVKDLGAYVPSGVAVATKAFEMFLKENGLEEEFNKLTSELDEMTETNIALKQKAIEKYAAKIRKLIAKGDLSYESASGRAIWDALAENGLANKYMAVRSSAVQEDTEEAAFAGAAETYLYVDDDQVLDKIKESWMSFFLPRGIAYRAEQGISQSEVKPAVTVQEMADAEKAGVMFTVNPVTGKEEVVINSSYGLGEVVVSGFVQGDMYLANKADGEENEFPFIGSKRVKIVKNSSGSGTKEVAVSAGERGKRSLTGEEVKKLTKIAVALENYFGYDLDIEFAVTGKQIAILQARPVTTNANDASLKDGSMTTLGEGLENYFQNRNNENLAVSSLFMQEKNLQMLLEQFKRILKVSPKRLKGVLAFSETDIANLSDSIKKLLKADGRATREEFQVIADQIAAVEEVFASVDKDALPKIISQDILKISHILVLLKSEEVFMQNGYEYEDNKETSMENSYREALKAVAAVRAAA